MAEPAAPVAPEPVETQDSVVADSAAVVEVPDTPAPTSAPVKRAPKKVSKPKPSSASASSASSPAPAQKSKKDQTPIPLNLL